MDAHWHIQMLGQLCARRGRDEVNRFRTRKTAELLAYLAFYGHRAQPRESLLDLLWAGEDIEAARNSLSVALNSLRKQFEPPDQPRGAFLFADRTHVRLQSGTFSTDVAEFERLLDEAERDEENLEQTALLTQAVALYQGDLLPGYYADWILTEQERLKERYIGALRRLVKALTQSRAYDRALDYAQQALHADPLREVNYRDAMRLYVAVGRPAAGLEKYQELARLLRETMGVQPAAATRELARQLEEAVGTREVSALKAPPLVAPPKDAPPPTAPAPIASPNAPLPAPFTRFFGRESELAALTTLLAPDASARLLTLTGPGGSGKTRLAIEAAHRLREAYQGATHFIALASLTDPALLGETVQDALGLPRVADSSPVEALAQAFGTRLVLLLLDNFEQLLPNEEESPERNEGAFFVQRLLERAPGVRCLVTSRRILDLGGEQEFPVPPLPTPSGARSPEALIAFPSVQLFVNRAQARRVDFQITAGNAEAVATVCEQLEGIPLALELAAGWAKMLTPAQMAQQLENRLGFLVSRHGDLPERHRTLRATIEASFLLLAPATRRFFARLGVFQGGWTLEAAERVCEEPRALERLLALRDSSLIQVEESETEMRYRTLETIRAFALEKLAAAEEDERFRVNHADYFLDWATPTSARLLGSGDEAAEAVRLLTLESDNLRAGMDAVTERNEQEKVVAYGLAFTRFLAKQSLYAECEARLTTAERAARTIHDLRSLAGLLNRHGAIAYERADYANARAYLQESYTLSKEIDYPLVTVVSLMNLGNLAWGQSAFDEARGYWEEALALTIAHQMQERERQLCNNLGLLAAYRADFAAAQRYFDRSRAIAQQTDNREGIANTLYIHFEMVWRQGQYATMQGKTALAERLFAQAEEEIEEAIRLFTELAMPYGKAMALIQKGDFLFEMGRIAESEACVQEGMRLAREAGIRLGEMYALRTLGRIGGAREEMEYAQEMLRESCLIAYRLGDRRQMADVLRSYGEVQAHSGSAETSYLALTMAAKEYAALRMMEVQPTLALRERQSLLLTEAQRDLIEREAQTLSMETLLETMQPTLQIAS